MGILDDADYYKITAPTADLLGSDGWFKLNWSTNLRTLEIASMGQFGWSTADYARAWIGFMTQV